MTAPLELVGNALCLDFVNTQNWLPGPERDRFSAAANVWQWGRQVGLELAAPRRTLTRRDLAQARELRLRVRAVFASVHIAGTDAIDLEALDAVRSAYAEAVSRASAVTVEGPGVRLRWPADEPGHVRFAVATSAFDLLLHGPLDRVGACPSCGWLFLDTTRNRSRRWCSMTMCGSREKARRYHRRHR